MRAEHTLVESVGVLNKKRVGDFVTTDDAIGIRTVTGIVGADAEV